MSRIIYRLHFHDILLTFFLIFQREEFRYSRTRKLVRKVCFISTKFFMKSLIYVLFFVVMAVESFAQTGLDINGVFYPSGSTYTLPCGSGTTVSIRGRYQGSNNVACNTAPSYPAGWTKTGSEALGCPIYTANVNGGGSIFMKLYSVPGSTNVADVIVYIQRPTPTLTFTAGAAQICAGQTQTFTINPGSTAAGTTTWSSGVYLTSPSPSSGLSTQVGRTGNGKSWVKAQFTNACGTYEKEAIVNAGTPVISYPNLWLFDAGSNMYQFSHSSQPNVTYSYSLEAGSAILNQNGNDCYITTTTGASVCITGTNTCGSDPLSGSKYCFYVPGTSGLRTYPNPAKDRLTVDVKALRSTGKTPSVLYLYSEKNPLVPVKKIVLDNASKLNTDGELELNVQGLPRGTYYLHSPIGVAMGKKTEKTRIVLE